MREIKFRVWDKILRDYSKNTMGWYHSKNGIVSPETGDRYIFEQYAGLKDKNGKEIYEGDIIVGTYKDMRTDTGLVVFKGCGFKVEIPNVGDDELVDWERYSDSIEVIGNIYENPELLKENG